VNRHLLFYICPMYARVGRLDVDRLQTNDTITR